MVAMERGPLVYCVEGIDHTVSVFDLEVPDDAALQEEYRPDLFQGVTVITGKVLANGIPVTLTAIPYYAWAHRGSGEMAVWLRRI